MSNHETQKTAQIGQSRSNVGLGLVTEVCDCCDGAGVLPSVFFDDLSGCFNCCGTGTLKYMATLPNVLKCRVRRYGG